MVGKNVEVYFKKLTPEDRASSATSADLPALLKALDFLKERGIGAKRLLDAGCGYGGLTKLVADYLEINEVYGIDMDEQRLSIARQRGVITYKVDLNSERFPFPDEYFDVVTSFGVIEHLVYYDNLLSESYRVLRNNGYFILAMPNLASYINRFALLLGFQPRDVEVSNKIPSQGFLPWYDGNPIGHIHSATLRSMKQLLKAYGFTVEKVIGHSPHVNVTIIRLLDKIFSKIPSWSRRFIIISRK